MPVPTLSAASPIALFSPGSVTVSASVATASSVAVAVPVVAVLFGVAGWALGSGCPGGALDDYGLV
ncbi:hypothetical protein [Acinetobacter sp. BSP-53]|uniref:hypothetical protein n=1 Tax=Acinetobacter sp. BSP-53 TaxID=3344662 RepID=UPI00376FCBD8